MPDNTNQTNQKDPHDRGPDDLAKALDLVRSLWWARRDLNPHERKAHKILSLACIPISPLALRLQGVIVLYLLMH
jgi:hypothetical protein